MSGDSFSLKNPTQILLIFESMQYCSNDQEQEKTQLFEHIFVVVVVFMKHIFLTLMLDAL